MSKFQIFISIILAFCSVAASQPIITRNTTVKCPLDFSIIRQFTEGFRPSEPVSDQCLLIVQGIRLVQSDYLRRTNSFLPPSSSSESCWNDYQNLINQSSNSFDIRTTCGFQTQWIAQGCENITTRSEYENINSNATLNGVLQACNQSLHSGEACATCTTSLSALLPSDVQGVRVGNVSDCTAFKSIYAAAFANLDGPANRDTAQRLFALPLDSSKSNKKHRNTLIAVFSLLVFASFVIAFVGFWWMWRKKREKKKTKGILDSNLSHLDSIGGNNALIKFSYSEVEKATKNFSLSNIIGRGGYGNVYKGVLPDRTEVALKRFKNCSAAGDASFAHEVRIIASVRHVNLVALRGYCIAMTKSEGHQRIIVCDLVKNGSLHDHLFGPAEKKLSWPIRQKIALGTARGLAYLHNGAQPSIIHRDIKAGNILLDEDFEPKVADFGLAKIAPEGVSHMSTHVAGTMGYVAPEYALYGKLTERSDVYSFGIVLLELVSGKKALLKHGDDQHTLLADWAWSLVKVGRPLDIVEEGTPELGPPEIMEKYVMLAVLCSHPQLYARPTMDQVVKILDSNEPVPVIPERPNSFTANVFGTETPISSTGSNSMSSYSTY
ncbi:hypothetical protein DCAR_0102905 [Daucus carota subsp. sativus]|uniref:non-specific serine/threonine protein kinase n=1 Tax=Daucus carota subsp. sativus TaxID=79200 RepID=A0AAF0W651_DAUCS|nr:hypothetical protein DCAR_0102905 [Daucus carota subsp. sativus]